MLSRSHRFHGYGSLRRTYNQGQSIRGSTISLRFSPRMNNKPYRVAVVVSRKVNKSAVVRNRIRRRVYEIVRQCTDIPSSTDLIFTVFSDQIAKDDIEKLQLQIKELLNKVTLQPKKSA